VGRLTGVAGVIVVGVFTRESRPRVMESLSRLAARAPPPSVLARVGLAALAWAVTLDALRP